MSREKSDLHNDSALCGFQQKIVIAREEFEVPFFQVEFISAARVAGRIAAQPRRQETAGLGSEIVVHDAERFRGNFDVGAGEEARVVQAVGFQRGEIAMVVKVAVQDRAVVFAACDEGDGLSAEEEIVRIRGMKTDGLRFGGLLCARLRQRLSRREKKSDPPNLSPSVFIPRNRTISSSAERP